jgi:surfeit locus 1 family protein
MMTSKVSSIFKPSAVATVVLFLLVVIFTYLGMWQTHRAAEKTVIEQQFESGSPVLLAKAVESGSRFAHIDESGHYDTGRHILLDNQVWRGRAGVHVFTPFYTTDGVVILVNRGWLPASADRQTLPEIPTPSGQAVLRGILNTYPGPGRVLGHADELSKNDWPQRVTYLNSADISAALDEPLPEWVVQLSETEPAGFEGRNWKPVFLTSIKHKAYAFQWFALAGISIVLWVFNGIRGSKGHKL